MPTTESSTTPRTAEDEAALLTAMRFACLQKLAANRSKGHWRGESANRLLKRCHEELLELGDAVVRGSAADIEAEAADVVIFAAMVADLFRRGECRGCAGLGVVDFRGPDGTEAEDCSGCAGTGVTPPHPAEGAGEYCDRCGELPGHPIHAGVMP